MGRGQRGCRALHRSTPLLALTMALRLSSSWCCASFSGSLSCFGAPLLPLLSCCLLLLHRCAFRPSRLLSAALPPESRSWSWLRSYWLLRCCAVAALGLPFLLSLGLAGLLAYGLIASSLSAEAEAQQEPPALLSALSLLYVITVDVLAVSWCLYCSSRSWQSERASRCWLRCLCLCPLLAEAAMLRWTAAGDFTALSCFFLTLNALPCLVLCYGTGGEDEKDGEPGGQGTEGGSGLSALLPAASPAVRVSLLRCVCLYALSLAVLLCYCVLMLWLSFGLGAVVVAAGAPLLDLVCLLALAAQHRPRPLLGAGFLLCSRAALAAGGQQAFLVAHSGLFAVVALCLAWQLTERLLPTRKSGRVRPFAHSPPAAAASDSPPSAQPGSLLPADSRVSAAFVDARLLSAALWLLCLLFAADCLLAYALEETGELQQLGDGQRTQAGQAAVLSVLASHPSLVVAGAALAGVLELVGLNCGWRCYYNAGFSISAGCAACLALCLAPVVAVAAALLALDAGWRIAGVLLLCLPLLLLQAAHLFCQWRLRDFSLSVAEHFAGCLQQADAATRAALLPLARSFDLRMRGLCCLYLASISGSAVALSLLCSPAALGPLLAVAVLVVSLTVAACCRFCHCLQWTRAEAGQLLLACCGVCGIALYLFLTASGRSLDGPSFLLLCLCCLYPACVCLLLAACRAMDDGWQQLSPFTAWMLLGSLLSLSLLSFLCSLLFPPWWLGAGGLTAGLGMLLAVLHALPALHHHGRHKQQQNTRSLSLAARAGHSLLLCLLCTCLSLSAAVAAVSADGWLGFSCLCASLGCLCLLYAAAAAVRHRSAALPDCCRAAAAAGSETAAAAAPSVSSLCCPPRSQLLCLSGEWLGLYALPSVSAHDASITPPLSLRAPVLALYAACCLLLAWGRLSQFFCSVSAALALACVCCGLCLLAVLSLHLRWLQAAGRQQREADLCSLRQLQHADDAAHSEGEAQRPEQEDGAQSDSSPLSARGLLLAARARARKSVPLSAADGDEGDELRLLASRAAWRLFQACLCLHLHGLLLGRQHERLQHLLAMTRQAERQRDRRDGWAAVARGSERLSLRCLVLLSLQSPPSPCFTRLSAALPDWERAQAARQVAAEAHRLQQETGRRRLRAARAAAAGRQEAQRAELLSHRKAERVKAMRAAREARQQEDRERQAALRAAVQEVRQRHRRLQREADSASGAARKEELRRARVAAKRRQQLDWLQHKQRIVQAMTAGAAQQPQQPLRAPSDDYSQLAASTARHAAAAAASGPKPRDSSAQRPRRRRLSGQQLAAAEERRAAVSALRRSAAAARRDRLRQQESGWQELQAAASERRLCTLKLTGSEPRYQHFFHCRSCASTAACSVCAAVCHAGHELEEAEPDEFYCECGLHTDACRCLREPAAAAGAAPATPAAPASETATAVAGSAGGASSVLSSPRCLSYSAEEAMDVLGSVAAACSASGQSWVDPLFPHSALSLFVDAAQPSQPSWQEAEWRRVGDAVSCAPQLFAPPVSADDIRQGRIGNCYFMSALAVLTLQQQQQLLFACFLTPSISACGAYAVRFFRDGQQRVVLIDDYVPCVPAAGAEGAGSRWQPLFAQSRESGEVWSLLIEKAFAKLNGSYEAIEGGWVDDALTELTGGVSERLSWQDADTRRAALDGSLFSRLLSFCSSGFMLGCASPAGASDREEDANSLGIVQSHAYSILGCLSADGLQLVHLRNPWGRKEWTGDWSDASPLWTARLRAKAALQVRDDGAFWMAWADFRQQFDELYVCRLFDAQRFPCRGQLEGGWDALTAGGCCNHPSVERNRQFCISAVEDGDVELIVELQQPDCRGAAPQPQQPLAILILELYDNDGRPVTQRRRGRLLANKGAAMLAVHLQLTWSPSAATQRLSLLPCTYTPGVLLPYSLRWFASRQVHVAAFEPATQSTEAAQPPQPRPQQHPEAAMTAAAESELSQSHSESLQPAARVQGAQPALPPNVVPEREEATAAAAGFEL